MTRLAVVLLLAGCAAADVVAPVPPPPLPVLHVACEGPTVWGVNRQLWLFGGPTDFAVTPGPVELTRWSPTISITRSVEVAMGDTLRLACGGDDPIAL